MFNKLVKELYTTKAWQIDPSVGASLAKQVLDNMANHSHVENGQNVTTELLVCRADKRREFKSIYAKELISNSMNSEYASLFSRIAVGDARSMQRWDEVGDDDEVINLVHIEGPITREGGACSYGSKDVRDEVSFASSMPQTIGHVFLINSPGGSSYSYNDYEMAIEAAKSAGQPTIGLIDGTCASAAMHLAALLDEVYYVHPKCQIGCIGTYGAFMTNKDGDKNTITQEVYHEIYASASKDKNSMYRLSADGDDSAVQEYINMDAQKFMDDVRTLRPLTPEEWLTGIVIDCDKTEGIWTEGRNTLEGCVERVIELNSKCGGRKPRR